MKEKTVIYIAGYGRSGSTLLERILSGHGKIFGTGELTNLLRLVSSGEDSFCSCGKKLQECEIWSDVVQDVCSSFDDIARLKKIHEQYESFFGVFACIFGYHTHKTAIYSDFSQKLLNSISQKLPAEDVYIVDSSKTARNNSFRPIMLSRVARLDVKVIHLVRDARGCMWSNLRGSNRRMERGLSPRIPFAALRSAGSWLFANLSAHIFQAFHPRENYYRIRYEDFVDQPEQILAELGRFLNIDFHRQMEMLQNKNDVPLGHQVSGNRLRSKRKIILKNDVEWKSKLRFRHKLLFGLLDLPLTILYNRK